MIIFVILLNEGEFTTGVGLFDQLYLCYGHCNVLLCLIAIATIVMNLEGNLIVFS